jgi:hypothetical protein
VSVANGRRTSRDGVLTEGVHLSGYPAKLVARGYHLMPKARPGLMPARQQMAVSTDALSAQ